MIRQKYKFLPVLLISLLATAWLPASGIPTATPAVKQTAVPAYWVPSVGDRLQVQYIDYPPDISVDADIFSLDLFETPQSSIDALHAAGKKVICYLDTGSWEDYRPDAGDFPDAVIGKDYEGWPGEKWLDIRNYEKFAKVIEARFDLAEAKGCDGVDADNMEDYQEENSGFEISADDQLAYNIWLSRQAHQRGMAIGLKNDAEQAEELLPYFDWSLVEECSVYGWCGLLQPFIQAGKPVFQVEYTETYDSPDKFCTQTRQSGYSGLLKNIDLDAWVEYCP